MSTTTKGKTSTVVSTTVTVPAHRKTELVNLLGALDQKKNENRITKNQQGNYDVILDGLTEAMQESIRFLVDYGKSKKNAA